MGEEKRFVFIVGQLFRLGKLRFHFLFVFFTLFVDSFVSFAQVTDVYTSNSNWTCPAGVTTVTVQCWGGGGAGGSISFSAYATPNNSAAGGGGAGGAYAEKVVSVTPGNVYTVTVAAAQNTSGAVGNDTWFNTSGTVIAKGGAGGQNVTSQTNGSGGVGSTSGSIGDVVRAGGNGAVGNRGGTGGAGGGGAGSTGSGGNASGGTGGAGATLNGGNGAAGVACGGGFGTGGNDGGNGNNYGGGGGGASACCSWCAASGSGGTGAPGYLKISYTSCTTTYSLTSASGTNSQTVCVNTPISNITYSVTSSGITGATVTGLPAGVNGSYSGGVVTISGTPSASGSFTYTVTVNASCGGTPATGTMTVKAQPTASAGGSKTICYGNSVAVSGASASNGTILWTHNGSGTLSNATTVAPSYNAVAGDMGNTVTLTMTVSNSPCTAATATYSIVVTGPPPVATLSGKTTITCNGNSTLSAMPAGGTWSSSNPAVATVNASTGKVSAVSSGTVTVSYIYSSGGCSSAPATIDLTVSGLASGVKAVASPNPVCEGNALTLTGAADGGVDAPTSWSWAGPNGFTSSSKSATIVNVTSAAAGTYTLTATNACGPVVVTTSAVSVGPQFNGGAAALSYLVCEGSSLNLMDATSGATSWIWTGPNNYLSTSQNPTISNFTEAAAGTYTLTASNSCGTVVAVTSPVSVVTRSNQSTTYNGVGLFTWQAPPGVTSLTVEAWGGGGSGSHGGKGTDGGGGGGGAYASSILTVIPGTTYNINVGAGGVTNCAGNTRVTGKDGGSSSFESEVIAAGGGGGGAVAATVYTGGTGGSAATSKGTTINPGGDGGCGNKCKLGEGPGNPGQSGTGNSAGGGGGDQYGNGGLGAGAGGRGGVGGYGKSDPGSCGVTSPGGGGGGTHTRTTGNNNGANGRVIISYDYGCPVRIVYGAEETMTSADEKAICSGSNVNLALVSTSADEFRWIASDNPNVSGESTTVQNSTTINNTLTNNTTTAQIVTYTVTPYTECGDSPHNAIVTLDPQVVSITVNPPNITMTSANTKTICSGDAVNLSLEANVPSSFTWKASNNTNTTGESTSTQTNDIIRDVLVNTSNADQTVTYTVTPTSANGIACAGTPQVINITVMNVPVLSSSTSPTTLCSGTAFTYTPTSTSADSAFTWFRLAVTGVNGADTSGIEKIYEDLINTSTSSKDVVYTYRITSRGCVNTQNLTVSVNPPPQGSLTGNTRSCGSIGQLTWLATSGSGPFTVEFAPGAAYNVNSGVAFDLDAGIPVSDSTFALTKVVDVNGCERTENFTIGTATVTVSGIPAAKTADPVSTTICEGATASFSVSGTNVGSYVWEVSTNGGGLFTPINAAGAGPVYANYTTPNLQVTGITSAHNGYQFRAVLQSGCGADITSTAATMSVNPIPTLTSGTGATGTVCTGGNVSYTPVASIGSSTFTWTRATVAGISEAGRTDVDDIAEVLTNTTTAAVDVTYKYVLTSPSGCSSAGSGEDVIFTINPNANIVLTSAAGTDAQRICFNDTLQHIVYTFNEGATGATVSSLPPGFITSLSGNTLTIRDTAKQEGYFTYTVTTTGACVQTSVSGYITVGLGLVSAVGTDTQNVCKNVSITDIVYYFAGGDLIPPVVTGLPPGVSGSITAPGELTISGKPSAEGTYSYTVTTNGACYPQNTLSGLLTVGMGLVTPGTDTQMVCKTDAITAIQYHYIGGGTPTVNGLPSGLTASVNATNDTLTISGAPTQEGIFRYEVATIGSCLQQSSFIGILTVGIGNIDPSTEDQRICKSDSIITMKFVYVGGGTPLATGLPSGLLTNVNASNDTLSISGTPTQEGSFTYTVSTTGTCGTQSHLTGRITIGLGLDTASANPIQGVCKGDTIGYIIYNVVGDSASVTATLPAGVSGVYDNVSKQFTISGRPTVEGTFNYTVSTNGGTCATPSYLTGILTVGLGLDSTSGKPIQKICKSDAIQPIIYNVVGDSASVSATLPTGVMGVYNTTTKQFTISGTPTVDGTYNFTVSTNGGTCAIPSSLTGSITIGLGLDTASAGSIQSICKGDSIQIIIYNVVDGIQPMIAGLPPGVDTTFNPLTSMLYISGTPTTEGAYTYTIIVSEPCPLPSIMMGTITVGIGLDSTSGKPIQDVCKGDAIKPVVYNVIGGAASVTSTLPAGVSGNYDNLTKQLTISGTPTVEGTYNFTVSTTGGTCAVPSSLTGSITVGLGLDSASANPVQDICVGDSIQTIIYNIVGDTASIATVLPTGVTGVYVDSTKQFVISGTPTQEGTFYFTVSTGGGTCATPSSLSGRITVGIGLDSTSANPIQNVCKGVTIQNIVYNIVGGAASVTATLPTGVTGSYDSFTAKYTITGTPTVEGTFNFTVSTSGGTCSTPSSLTGIITVGIGLDSTSGSNIQDVCKDDAIQPIVYNVVGGAASVTATLPTGVTGTFMNLTQQFVISGTPSIEGIYGYTVSTNGGTCVTPSSLTGIITVGGGLDTAGGSNVQDICKGLSIKPIKYRIVGGSATVAGLPPGLTGVMTTTGSPGVFTISGSPNGSGVFVYILSTNGTCATQSIFTGTITINEANIILTTPITSASQKLCSNIAIDTIAYTIGGAATGISILPSLPLGMDTTYVNGEFEIYGTPDLPEGVHTFTVVPSGTTCSTPTPVTFTINISNPTASFTTNVYAGMPTLPVNFTNTSTNADTYNWSFGEGTTSALFNATHSYGSVGTYEVQLIVSTNSQCPDTATTNIIVYDLSVPNIFSPNGDNINDIFSINSLGVAEMVIEIYNRWGVKVYEWNAINGGWDGINFVNNLPSPEGTYYYILKQTDILGQSYQKKGHLMLVR